MKWICTLCWRTTDHGNVIFWPGSFFSRQILHQGHVITKWFQLWSIWKQCRCYNLAEFCNFFNVAKGCYGRRLEIKRIDLNYELEYIIVGLSSAHGVYGCFIGAGYRHVFRSVTSSPGTFERRTCFTKDFLIGARVWQRLVQMTHMTGSFDWQISEHVHFSTKAPRHHTMDSWLTEGHQLGEQVLHTCSDFSYIGRFL